MKPYILVFSVAYVLGASTVYLFGRRTELATMTVPAIIQSNSDQLAATPANDVDDKSIVFFETVHAPGVVALDFTINPANQFMAMTGTGGSFEGFRTFVPSDHNPVCGTFTCSAVGNSICFADTASARPFVAPLTQPQRVFSELTVLPGNAVLTVNMADGVQRMGIDVSEDINREASGVALDLNAKELADEPNVRLNEAQIDPNTTGALLFDFKSDAEQSPLEKKEPEALPENE